MHPQNKFVKTLFDFKKGQVLPVPSFVYNQFVHVILKSSTSTKMQYFNRNPQFFYVKKQVFFFNKEHDPYTFIKYRVHSNL